MRVVRKLRPTASLLPAFSTAMTYRIRPSLGCRIVCACFLVFIFKSQQINSLNVEQQLRAVLAFRGVTHDSKLLKPALRTLLVEDMQLPSEGTAPAFVLPQPSAPQVVHDEHASDDESDHSVEDDDV